MKVNSVDEMKARTPELKLLKSGFADLVMTREETEIARLIEVCAERGILNEPVPCEGRADHFELSFKAGGRVYTLCFGCDPDRAKFPRAERASRAARFVDDLLQRINAKYNCYVVAAGDIAEPEAKLIRSRVIGNGRYEVELKGQGDAGGSQAEFTTFYELEVMVIIAIGRAYHRTNECVVMEVNADDTVVRCEYGSTDKRKVTDSALTVDKAGGAKSVEEANRIFKVIREMTTKQTVLDTLAHEKTGEVHKFLDDFYAKEKAAHPNDPIRSVGQVEIRPTSIFVDAIREKTFTYTVKGEDAGVYDLRVTWDKTTDRFTKDTALYIVAEKTEDGQVRFGGLTYQGIRKDAQGNEQERLPFEDNKGERLVPVYRYDAQDGTFKKDKWVLLPPAGAVTAAATSYKGLTEWAVRPDGFSDALKAGPLRGVDLASAYFLSTDTECVKTGQEGADKRFLSVDCGTCAYTGKRMWRGDLSAKEEYFIPEGTCTFQQGYITTELANEDNKRTCDFCTATFYATPAVYEDYRTKESAYRLLDGACKCYACKVGAVVEHPLGSGARCRLTEKVYNTDETVSGELYVWLDDKKQTVRSIAEGGNAYTCSHCGKLIYHPHGAKPPKKCRYCEGYLSEHCDMEAMNDPNLQTIDDHYHCNGCKTAAGMRIYDDVYKMDEETRGKIPDKAADPTRLFRCTTCGKLILKPPAGNKTFPACGCDGCERARTNNQRVPFVGAKCWGKEEKNEYLGVKLCGDCKTAIRENKGEMEAMKAQLERHQADVKRYEEAQRKLIEEHKALREKWPETVWREIHKFLPYLSFTDRCRVLRARRTKKNYGAVLEFDSKQLDNVAIREEQSTQQYYAKFSFRVKDEKGKPGRPYSFLYDNGRVTLEEVGE